MGVSSTLLYVAGAATVVMLATWLINRWRGPGPHMGRDDTDARLVEAHRRYEAGEMTESELRRVEEHVRKG